MKKYLVIALSFVLGAAIAVGGTVAYLTNQEGIKNVMTLGNVNIEQLEYERVVDDNGNWTTSTTQDRYTYYPDLLQVFTQNKPLYPAVYRDGRVKWDDRNGSEAPSGAGSHQQSWAEVGASGSNQLFDDSVKNVQDKFVFVKNTGNTDAYVRTIFAFEAGTMTVRDVAEDHKLHTNINDNHWTAIEWVNDYVTVDGVRYVVGSVVYKGPTSNPTGILAPGKISYPSLLQVFLDPTTTNEDCASFGAEYDILVLSQAVQAAGFDNATEALNEAYGVVDADNAAEWIEAVA